jgi:hypothetical protein
MDEELSLIEEDGMFMVAQTALPYPINNELPLEICFIIGRAGYTDVFILTTHWDYPNTPPRVYKAPFTGVDPTMYIYQVFEQLWEKAEPVEYPPDFTWEPESSYMVDLLAAVEQHLGMRPDDLPMPWERSNLSAADVGADGDAVSIAVDIDDDAESSNPDDASTEASTETAPVDETADTTDDTDTDDETEAVASVDAATDETESEGAETDEPVTASESDDTDDDKTATDDDDETVAEAETSEDKAQ